MNARNENSVTTSLGELRQLEHARLAAERGAREEQRALEAAAEQRAREAAAARALERQRDEERRHHEAAQLAAAEARRATVEAELRLAEVRARAATALAVQPTPAPAPAEVRPRTRWLAPAVTSALAVAALVLAVGFHQRASAAERRARAAHAELAELRAALDAAQHPPARVETLPATPTTLMTPAPGATAASPASITGVVTTRSQPRPARPRPSTPPTIDIDIDPVHTLGGTTGQ